jgi:hypothetical protein
VYGPICFVAWSGVPASSFQWTSLAETSGKDRFHVGVYPASDGLEARWEDGDGGLKRLLSVSGGEIVENLGDGRLVDERADDDRSLYPTGGRPLRKSVVDDLLAGAAPQDVMTYDGRRYVRTDDQQLLADAKVYRVDKHGRTWVGVDQKGPINTLRDPLRNLDFTRKSVETIADRLCRAWFDFSMHRPEQPVPAHLYARADAVDASADRTVDDLLADDPARLLSELAEPGGLQYVREKYGLSREQIEQLLARPVGSFLRSGAGRI